jgi:hypothetical protein
MRKGKGEEKIKEGGGGSNKYRCEQKEEKYLSAQSAAMRKTCTSGERSTGIHDAASGVEEIE